MANNIRVLAAGSFDRLIQALLQRGYTVVGPALQDGAIVYTELSSASELPAGWTDIQSAGEYRTARRDDNALFGYAVGPHSWKKFLYPPVERVFRAERTGTTFVVQPETVQPQVYAFLGVRSCELHAIEIQDRIYMQGSFVDPGYRSRRQGAFIVALNCSTAGGTCFCVSMKTGPKVTSPFDIAMTEVIKADVHYFVLEAGSDIGSEILDELNLSEAAVEQTSSAESVVARTAGSMGRTMDTGGIKELLYRNADHPRWDDVANRCLTCANCTMVCPTCFCMTVEDTSDLSGDHAERWRKWDSCFTMDFSYIHGGSVRSSTKARYRQWMTHKLASWIDQFGTSGCVGCGRCITWCPVGIDITEEVRAIRGEGDNDAKS